MILYGLKMIMTESNKTINIDLYVRDNETNESIIFTIDTSCIIGYDEFSLLSGHKKQLIIRLKCKNEGWNINLSTKKVIHSIQHYFKDATEYFYTFERLIIN